MESGVRRVYPWGLVLRALGLLAAYSVTRAVFYLANQEALSSFSTWDIVRAFGLGFRFDAWVVTASLLPLFCLELWSWRSRAVLAARCAALYSGFVLCLHSVLIFCELADSQYFKFTGRRTTLAILRLSSDARDQSLQLLQAFWFVPVVSFVLVGALILLWHKTRNLGADDAAIVGWKTFALHFVVGAGVGVMGLRGGLQTKPIATAHAMLLGHSQLAGLALSTSFQMTHSAENRHLSPVSFFESDQAARDLLEVPRERHAPVVLKNHNVVLLVVESLSLEYTGYRGISPSFTPFLNKLAQKSLYFDNAYANGRTSIESFPSLLASMPSMIGDPFITSQYSSVRLKSLGHELAARGYSNQFFHGCNNGSMYIDSMAKLFGFGEFFGRSEYSGGDKDYDGSWGIFDEPFLQFALSKINTQPQPFGVGVFTLSSHNPFRIPEALRDKLPEGNRPFQKSLAYADYAVERFFQEAEKQPWFKSTLFVITGDHTAELESPLYLSEQGYYRVPLLFYDPSGALQPAVSHRIVQHTDVFPSVLDLLGIEVTGAMGPILPFGQSVFLPDHFGRAANRAGDWFWYQEGRTVVRFPADVDAVFVEASGNSGSSATPARLQIVELGEDTLNPAVVRGPTAEESEGIVARARAYLQFYNNGLIRNTLF